MPALTKVGPNQRTMAKVQDPATPLKAREAIRGAPSPWRMAREMMAAQTKMTDERKIVSAKESPFGAW